LLRLRGARAAVESTCVRLGGRRLYAEEAAAIWRGYRDHSAPWFAMENNQYDLWRVSVPQTAPVLPLVGTHLIEWHGGLRWYCLPPGQATTVREVARAAGGHATLFRPGIREAAAVDNPDSHPFDSLSPSLTRIHQRLKHEFDPRNIFNRGRLYSDL
jgi:glycolate oxidase FAD binding subunit